MNIKIKIQPNKQQLNPKQAKENINKFIIYLRNKPQILLEHPHTQKGVKRI